MPDGTASLELAGACLTALLCFDDLGGAVAAGEASAALPPAAPLRAAIEALTAWHLWLLGDLSGASATPGGERRARVRCWRTRRAGVADAPPPHRAARRDKGRGPRRPARRLWPPGAAAGGVPPARCSSLVAAERGDVAPRRRHADDAVAARDAGPLRGAPHTLPVTCAAARVQVITGRPDLRRGAVPRGAGVRARLARQLADGARRRCASWPARTPRTATTRRPRPPRARRRSGSRGARDAGALPAKAPSLRAVEGVDELSAREVEVLAALGRPGSLREVADQLFISRNTIKTHTRALYGKLGVASREEAVEKGRALGLLSEGTR